MWCSSRVATTRTASALHRNALLELKNLTSQSLCWDRHRCVAHQTPLVSCCRHSGTSLQRWPWRTRFFFFVLHHRFPRLGDRLLELSNHFGFDNHFRVGSRGFMRRCRTITDTHHPAQPSSAMAQGQRPTSVIMSSRPGPYRSYYRPVIVIS